MKKSLTPRQTITMHRLVLLFLVSIGLLWPAFNMAAQGLFDKPLTNILIVGNDHTKEEVIRRELLFKTGQVLTDSLLEKSKKRLENLWLFNRIEFFPLPDSGGVTLLISVTERLYIFPYPELTFEDRDWKKITYGFGFAHDNFRGRNEKLYLSILFGNRPGFRFTYFNPWLHHNWHLVTGFFIKKYLKENQSPAAFGKYGQHFDEDHLYLAFTLGKYWTRDFSSRVSFYRDQISLPKAVRSELLSDDPRDVNYGLMFTTTYDSRDVYAYPNKGWYFHFRLKSNGLFSQDIDYSQYLIDIRRYLSWRGLILALRTYTQQSLGTLPVYDRVYFGYSERIRGHFNEVREGRHSFLTSLALRFPLLKLRYYSFPTLILPDYYTRNLKFGINAGLFFDSGIVWENRDELNYDRSIRGFGGGIHFLVPYLEVIRFDIGFNEKLQHEFIFEVEMAF